MSWRRRQEAEGEEPRRGCREGAGSRAGGHQCCPRRALCRRRRLGGWGVAGAVRAGGAARGGAPLFCLLLSLWSGSGCGEAPAPSGRPANGGGSSAALREGKGRGGLPGRRGEQVRARAGESGERRGSAEGAAIKARRPGCRRLSPRPRPAPVLFAPGCAEGFSGGCGGDTGWALRGKGAECLRATVGGERHLEKGHGARRACPRGSSGAGQG